jgi:hypothetical protein
MTTTNETATLIRMSLRSGASCAHCDVRIERGTYCYAANGLRWHTECPSVAPAPVATVSPAPVASDPVLARALAPHLAAGRLPVYGGPERLSDYEAEYENEGR